MKVLKKCGIIYLVEWAIASHDMYKSALLFEMGEFTNSNLFTIYCMIITIHSSQTLQLTCGVNIQTILNFENHDTTSGDFSRPAVGLLAHSEDKKKII
jgi:hypothetical protein